jgi:hypothetical protein
MTKTCPKYKTTRLITCGFTFEDRRAGSNLAIFAVYFWTVGIRDSVHL